MSVHHVSSSSCHCQTRARLNSVHHVSSSFQFIIMSLSIASSTKLSSSRQFIISVHHHVTVNRELDYTRARSTRARHDQNRARLNGQTRARHDQTCLSQRNTFSWAASSFLSHSPYPIGCTVWRQSDTRTSKYACRTRSQL